MTFFSGLSGEFPNPGRRLKRALWSDQKGGVLIYVALLTIPLIASVGLALDAARAYMIKGRLGNAVDAAALAGGRSFHATYRDEDILKYFSANFEDGLLGAQVNGGQPGVTVDSSAGTVMVEASVTVPTLVMQLFGYESLSINARAVVQRETRGLELALVMDNTGSMSWDGKMTAMKAAAVDLIDRVYGSEDTLEEVTVALVPFVATVNIGSTRTDWLNLYDETENPQGYAADRYAPTTWKGCVQARPSGNDLTDTPPPSGAATTATPNPLRWDPHFWESTLPTYGPNGDNDWDPTDSTTIDERNSARNSGTGPNLGCGPEITPLVQSKATVLAAIDEMEPWHRGGTLANLGLVWGWRTLSPNWRGLWGDPSPAGSPLDYNDPDIDKVIVLLTDGVNQIYDWPGGEPDEPEDADYTAYGRLSEELLGAGINSDTAARTEINARLSELCDSIKDAGITIFTILFQVNDWDTETLYQECASSDEHFFDAETNGSLADAFLTIGNKLSELRIAE